MCSSGSLRSQGHECSGAMYWKHGVESSLIQDHSSIPIFQSCSQACVLSWLNCVPEKKELPSICPAQSVENSFVWAWQEKCGWIRLSPDATCRYPLGTQLEYYSLQGRKGLELRQKGWVVPEFNVPRESSVCVLLVPQGADKSKAEPFCTSCWEDKSQPLSPGFPPHLTSLWLICHSWEQLFL